MDKILFDASSHLGQLCTTNEDIRRGCKNMQSGFDGQSTGMWTDLENGRTDATIWTLERELQDKFYPLMDRYFSIMNTQQPPFSEKEEDLMALLKKSLPALSLYSRNACAAAIANGATEIHTLVRELLSNDTQTYMASRHGVKIVRPENKLEYKYEDALLEEQYRDALQVFRAEQINLPAHIVDVRELALD